MNNYIPYIQKVIKDDEHNINYDPEGYVFIILYDNHIYFVNILAGELQEYNSCVMNGSHDDYINYLIQSQIKNCLNTTQVNYSFDINYNYTQEETYLMHFDIRRILNNDILDFNSISNPKKIRFDKYYDKILSMIQFAGNKGISLSELFSSSRKLNPEERKRILRQLIDDNKIKEEKHGEGKKKTFKYYYISYDSTNTKYFKTVEELEQYCPTKPMEIEQHRSMYSVFKNFIDMELMDIVANPDVDSFIMKIADDDRIISHYLKMKINNYAPKESIKNYQDISIKEISNFLDRKTWANNILYIQLLNSNIVEIQHCKSSCYYGNEDLFEDTYGNIYIAVEKEEINNI